jgi:hypothetical protein
MKCGEVARIVKGYYHSVYNCMWGKWTGRDDCYFIRNYHKKNNLAHEARLCVSCFKELFIILSEDHTTHTSTIPVTCVMRKDVPPGVDATFAKVTWRSDTPFDPDSDGYASPNE